MSRLELSAERLNRNIVKLAAPALIDSLTMSVQMFIVNMVFSRRLGTEALAGVGTGQVCFFVVMALFMAIGAGATALVAQASGARNPRQASRFGGQALLLAVCVGLFFAATLIPFSGWMVRAIGARGEAAEIGAKFLAYLYLALPMAFFVNIGAGVLRGYGDTVTPMFVVGGMNLLNGAGVALRVQPGDPLVAAVDAGQVVIATRLLATIVMSVILFSRLRGIRIGASDILNWYVDSMRKIARLALPVAGEQIIMRVGFVAFNAIVLALGTASFASHRLGVSVESLSFMPAFAFQIAATTLVGQAVGARDYDLAKQSTKRLAAIGIAVSATTGTALWFVARPVVYGMFQPEPEVARIATLCIQISAFEQTAFALLFVYAGSLRGAGDTLSPMLVTLIGSLFFRIPLAYVAGITLGLGLPGVWAAAVFEWWGRTAVIYYLYKRGRWLRLKPQADLEETLEEVEEEAATTVRT